MDSSISIVDNEMDIVPALPDNTPRWATENYTGAAEDFSDWMLRVQYSALSNTKATARERMALALANSLKATFNLQEVVERAKILQLWKAQKTGWFHLLPQRYDTASLFLKELLSDASKTESSDLIFMIDSLLPACEYLGIPAETVVGFPAYYSKARAAVPALRDAWRAMDSRYRSKLSIKQDREGGWQWRCGGLGGNDLKTKEDALLDYQKHIYTILTDDDRVEFVEMLHRVIEMIPQEMSVRNFEKEMYRIRGKSETPKELANTILIILPGKKELLIVRSPDASLTKRIEHQIEDLTTGPSAIRDPTYLSKEVKEWFDLTVSMATYSFDMERNGFVEDATGVILPTPEGMVDLVRSEIPKMMPVIEQVFRRGITEWDVPIYFLVSAGVNISRVVCDRFNISMKSPEDEQLFAMNILPDALLDMYSRDFDKAIGNVIQRDMQGFMRVDLFPDTGQWGIFVTIRKVTEIQHGR